MSERTAAESAASFRDMLRDLVERSRTLREEVLRENERLRTRIEELETDLTCAESVMSKEFDESWKDREQLHRRAEKLAEENREFAQRQVELEDHTTSLANLYAATFQLHSTLDPNAVVQCIVEIALNLIGADEFVLYIADDTKGDLVLAAREGDLPPNVARVPSLTHAIEQAAIEMRRTVFAEEGSAGKEGPICCAPLFFRERLVGVLTIYALLSHKKTFSQLDRELFDLLGEQAALAIVSSQSYVSVDRKLKTVQRFMDLLKNP